MTLPFFLSEAVAVAIRKKLSGLEYFEDCKWVNAVYAALRVI